MRNEATEPNDVSAARPASSPFRLVGRSVLGVLLAALFALPAMVAAQQMEEIREEGLVANYFRPSGDASTKAPGIVVLGGSEGGILFSSPIAESLAEEGYATLAVAYFDLDPLPQQLIEIPLEGFTRAIDHLVARPEVDGERIGIVGVSKGGEAVLLVASRDPRVKAVVSSDPSHVVWQAVDRAEWQVRSSWSVDGEPLDFVPYDGSKGFDPLLTLYQTSLGNEEAVARSLIPVERIAGAVLLLSGKDDQVWPSSEMADLVMQRLEKKNFTHPFDHLAYENAGHGVLRPPVPSEFPPDELAVRDEQAAQRMGGTVEGNRAAQKASWPAVLAFFEKSLRGN